MAGSLAWFVSQLLARLLFEQRTNRFQRINNVATGHSFPNPPGMLVNVMHFTNPNNLETEEPHVSVSIVEPLFNLAEWRPDSHQRAFACAAQAQCTSKNNSLTSRQIALYRQKEQPDISSDTVVHCLAAHSNLHPDRVVKVVITSPHAERQRNIHHRTQHVHQKWTT